MKTCSKCLCPQEDAQFYKQISNRDGLKSKCKTCASLSDKARYKNMSPDQRAAEKLRGFSRRARDKIIPEAITKRSLASRKHLLKSSYGLTLETWSQMLAEQGGVCAICKSSPPPKRNFVVDHNHITGKLRGLLCVKCNCALGLLKESPIIAASLIQYINKHTAPS